MSGKMTANRQKHFVNSWNQLNLKEEHLEPTIFRVWHGQLESGAVRLPDWRTVMEVGAGAPPGWHGGPASSAARMAARHGGLRGVAMRLPSWREGLSLAKNVSFFASLSPPRPLKAYANKFSGLMGGYNNTCHLARP